MPDHLYTIGVIALLFCATLLTRSLPFMIGNKMKDSQLMFFLAKQLPACIVALLTLYYIILLAKPSHWHNLPWQLVALAITLLVHLRWRNIAVSLFVGTGCYLLLSTFF